MNNYIIYNSYVIVYNNAKYKALKRSLSILTALCLLCSICLPSVLTAEGTFEIQGRSGANPDILMEAYGPGLTAFQFNLGLPRATVLRVDILNFNEVIDIYTNKFQNATDIKIWAPGADIFNDTPVFEADVLNGGAGYINSWQDVVDVQSIASRPRAPVTFEPSGTGAYQIVLFSDQTSGNTLDDHIRFFDIAVRDDKGTSGTADDNLRRGRLWTDHLSMNARNFGNAINSTFFLVDVIEDNPTFFEGFLWKGDLNGIQPFGFHFYVNRVGPFPQEHHFQSIGRNATPTPVMVPDFPIYFNFPAKPVVNPEIPEVSDLVFKADCVSGTPQGGDFEFNTNGDWEFEITIDENNDGTFNRQTERAIIGQAQQGFNSIPWDGKFKDGTDAPNGINIQIVLRTRASEAHFPFFDVENNGSIGPTGPIFELLPSDNSTSKQFFWDDTQVGGNAELAGTTTPHVWGAGIGDDAIVDTWKVAFFDISELQVAYNCTSTNLLADKQVDIANPFAGQQIQYLLTVLNQGPNAATGITMNDDLPADVTYVSDDGGGDYNTSTGIWTVGDLNSGDADTLRIDATVDAGTSGSTITNTLSVDGVNETDNDPSNNTSNADIIVGLFNINGTVFEDIQFGGGSGRSFSAANNPEPKLGVTVELYNANNGAFVADTVTDSDGEYQFQQVPNGDYFVRVANSTVQSTRLGSSGSLIGVQTFRREFDGNNFINVTNEVGGSDPSKVDAGTNDTESDFSTLTSGNVVPQSVSTITVQDAEVNNIDFGFNFNTVVNTNDSDQGSLRQAINNINNLSNLGLQQDGLSIDFEHIIFNIPTTDVNYDGAAFTITPASSLPDITDSFTNINGSTQTTFTGNTNPAVEDQSTGPEIIINGSNSTGSPILNVISEGLKIEGLGLIQSGGTASNGAGIVFETIDASRGIIENSTLASNSTFGARLNNGVNQVQVLSSVFFNNGTSDVNASGFLMDDGDGAVISNSSFASNSGNGVTLMNAVTNVQIIGNRFVNNGTGNDSRQDGLAIEQASGTSVIDNLFDSNTGDGISVQMGTVNTISKNRMLNNGDLGIDLGNGNNGDGVTLNDQDDTDSGPNGLFNFPILESAQIQDGNLVITGFARPGSVIELFEADNGSNDFGEGADFLFTVTEGSAQDNDATSGSYSGPVNGVDQGTDNTEKFMFVVLNPPGLTLNDELTATATDANGNTSEFSGRVSVGKGLADIKGFVYDDSNHNTIKDGSNEGGNGLSLFAKLISSGNVEEVVSVDPNTGAYTFSGINAGTYKIIVDDNNTTGDTTPTLPNGWIPTTAALAEIGTFTMGVNDINNLNIGLFNGSLVEGIIVNDNGIGGGKANDGLQNGGEVGLGNVQVQAIKTSGGSLLDESVTETDGSFKLFIPDAEDGASVSIVEIDNGFISTGGDPGTTGGTYDQNTDRVTFTNNSGTIFSNITMGDVQRNAFEANMQRDILKGTITFIPHTYRARTAGDVTFSITDNPSPNITGWSAILYHDVNADGEFQPGEPQLSETDAVSLTANEEMALLVKYNAPVNAAVGNSNLFKITSSFDYTGANPALQRALEVEDLINVNDKAGAGLELKKEVNKETALPGSQIVYTITYSNLSADSLSSLKINDSVPSFTEFTNASTNTLGDGLTGVTITSPPVGDTGSIVWDFQGSLSPGATGSVSYIVTVEN